MKKDYIIRGKRVTIHGHDTDHIIGEIISEGKNIIKGIKPKLTKNKFYEYRGKMYDAVSKIYGNLAYEKLPGNPFAIFSHASIHDAPLKDYTDEQKALNAMLLKYFPKVFGDVVPVQTAQQIASEITNEAILKTNSDAQYAKERGTAGPALQSNNTKVLIPFKPIMKVGVSNAGFVPPDNTDALALLFYEKVVQPGTQSTYDCDSLDEIIVESILHFIATLQQKREAGEPMNKTYTAIADKATQLQEQGTSVAKDAAGAKIGSFVLDNGAILIGIGIIAVILLAKK